MRRTLSVVEKSVAVVLLLLTVLLLYRAWRNWSLAGNIDDALNYYNCSEFTLARESVNSAIDLAPDEHTLLLFKGETLAAQRQFGEAEKVLREVHRMMPNDDDVRVSLASVLAEEGEIDEAEELVTGVDSSEGRLVAAGIAFKKGDVQKAERLLSSVEMELGECSFNAVAAFYLLKGNISLSLKRYKEAVQNAIRLISYIPRSSSFRPCRGRYEWLLSEGQRLMRSASVEWLSSAKGDVSPIVEEVALLIGQDASERYGVAARFWYRMPYDFTLYLACAEALFRSGESDDAVKFYERSAGRLKRYAKKYPDFLATAYFNAGCVRRVQAEGAETKRKRRSYFNRAAEQYAKVLSVKGVSAERKFQAANLCAICYFNAGSYRLASQYFERALSYGVHPHIPTLNLAVCYDKAGNRTVALKWYRRLLGYEEFSDRAKVERRIEKLSSTKEKKR